MRTTPLAVFALFCIGLQTIVGFALGLSNGLSETHKTVLVGFIVCFPAVSLFLLMSLMSRLDRPEATPFRSRQADLTPEPFATSVTSG
jgi:hypothetical protein